MHASEYALETEEQLEQDHAEAGDGEGDQGGGDVDRSAANDAGPER